MAVADPPPLSRREREIAEAYAEGASYRQIGARLFIAPSTVRTHLGTIYRKLGVSSKVELFRTLALPLAVDDARPAGGPGPGEAARTRRASVAVMPLSAPGGEQGILADGFVQDIITRLAKLRGVRVTARGSVFALAERGLASAECARLLRVEYLVTGSLVRRDDRLVVAVELAATPDLSIVWAETFERRRGDTFAALDDIVDRIVASLAGEIESAERNRALLKHPSSLDAWESFHRGLWHLYRFTAAENEKAHGFLRRAVELDPTFARAHAGISFTHFQNAFLLKPLEREREVGRALESAGDAVAADERDPSAHWALGRALWLSGAQADAVEALETSVALSPHFALGHYALAFVNCQSGDPAAAIGSVDVSRSLSPFDPLLFAMYASRALALLRLGAVEEAAEWSVRAALRPNAHVHILAIAALCLAAAGRLDEGRSFAAATQRAVPSYGLEDFLAAFRMREADVPMLRRSAARIGWG